MPAMLGYPLLGFVAGSFIVFASSAVVGYYAPFFYPLLLLAIATGIAAAREWGRRARSAFVWACFGVILASFVAIPVAIPIEDNSLLYLALTVVGMVVGAVVGALIGARGR